MTFLERAREARRLIAQGWVQKRLGHPDNGGVCLLGGVLHAGPTAKGEASPDSVMRAVAEEVGIPRRDVVDWNNAPERTQADVVGALDRIIAKREEHEGEHEYIEVPEKVVDESIGARCG